MAISLTDVQTSSESVYSDLGKNIVDGTREKRDCLPSLLEQKHISLFYCNSRKAILNPHQHGSETKFRRKSFGSLFFRKGTVHAFCVAFSYCPRAFLSVPANFCGSMLCLSCPFFAIEMLPVSSDTTITTASVSSLMPIAERWRVP